MWFDRLQHVHKPMLKTNLQKSEFSEETRGSHARWKLCKKCKICVFHCLKIMCILTIDCLTACIKKYSFCPSNLYPHCIYNFEINQINNECNDYNFMNIQKFDGRSYSLWVDWEYIYFLLLHEHFHINVVWQEVYLLFF